MPPPHLLVVGSLNLDIELRLKCLPVAGANIIVDHDARSPGGKGANQAIAIARLNAQATLTGKVGADTEGEAVMQALRTEGVCTDFITATPLCRTGLAIVVTDKNSQNVIFVVPGANAILAGDNIDHAFAASSYDAVLLQLEIPERAVARTCHAARDRGIPVILDAGPAQDFPLEQLDGVTILSPNESETFALTGIRPLTIPHAKHAAEVLIRRARPEAVVLKLGERGAFVYAKDGACVHLPGHSVHAVDATGSGDAFMAALAIAYVQTNNLRQAVEAGNAAGALAATKYGAQASLPTAGELSAFLAERGAA